MGNTYIFDDSHDYTGAVATFTDTHGTSRITNISVPFSPIQDLHGYSHPWPAGGGKNLLENTMTSKTEAGVTYTVNADGTVVLSGVASNPYSQVTVSTISLEAGSYIISDGGLTQNGIEMYLSGVSNATTRNRNGGAFTLTESITNKIVYFYVPGGIDMSGKVLKPMICKASATDPRVFAPYSNICPISGRTGLSVYRTGVNVWDEEWEVGGIGALDGLDDASPTIRSKNYIPVLPNTSYYVGWPWTGNVRTRFYDADKNYLGYVQKNGTAVSSNSVFVTPDDCHYMRFQTKDGTGTTYNHDISINYPSTDTDYHAYQGNTYAVDWTSQAGTVYGGTVDVVTGVLTVDKATVTYNGTESWSKAYGLDAEFYTPLHTMARPADNTYQGKIICDKLKTYSRHNSADLASAESGISGFAYGGYVGQNWIYAKANGAATVEEFKEWITNNPIQVVYKLATPITYQLTAQEVSVIKNSLNNVWASTGSSITVTVKDIAYGFQGWLVKVGSSLTLVPTEMIEAESYKVTPDQRMEESAERDTTGYLWRDTVRNTPPKIEFNTPPVNNTQVAALNAIFQSAFTVKSQRKLQVAFFDPEEDCYKIWDCYMPDVEYPMHLIDPDAKTILYDSIRYAFIGY